MRQFLALCLSLFLMVFSANSQTYLSEDFNNGIPQGFVIGNGGYPELPFNYTWEAVEQYTEPNPPFAVRKLTNTPFLFCNGQLGGPGSFMDDTITTPSFNTQNAPVLLLEYLHFYRDLWSSPNDSGFVYVYDGSAWVGVDTITRADSGFWTVPKKARLNVTLFKNPNFRVRFRYKGTYGYYWAIDNLKIYVPQAKDVGVTSIMTPASPCGIGPSIKFRVRLTNFGSTAQSNFPVSFQVNNGPVQTETYVPSIVAGGNPAYTFTTSADLVPEGVFRVKIWTSLSGDGSPENDTTEFVFTRYGQGFPVFNFSQYSGNIVDDYPGWKEQAGHKPAGFTSAWQRCTPEQESGLGSVTAKVNLLTNVYREWLITPPFKPTSVSGIRFKAAVTDFGTAEADQMGSDDSLKVMVSTDCGATWKPLFFLNAANNLTNTLTQFVVPLQLYDNQEIRIGFKATDGKVNNDEDYDLHLDDVEIVGLPPVDVGVSLFKSPLSDCGLSNSSQVKVTLRNYGSVTQTGFPVNYRINGGPVVTETFTGNIQPNQAQDFTFSTAAAIAVPGTYQFDVWTGASGDANRSNDSLKGRIVQNTVAITTFPYFQNFELGKGGWESGGNFSSWAFGGPNKVVFTGPASGSNCWTTGGLSTGTYNSNEKSFLLSPCFDFSSLIQPVIELKIWWHTEIGRDGAALQASVDGGTSWQNIGRFGDPNNWYNQQGVTSVGPEINPLEVWCGGVGTNLNGSGGWVLARNLIKTTALGSLAGYTKVKLRIMFGANNTVSGDGIAIDDIRIFEAPLKDLELTSIVSPLRDGCGFNNAVPLKIKLLNKGREPISNIPVRYQLNNNPIVQETISASIDTNSSYEYTFSQTLNLASPKNYILRVWIEVPGDAIANNDTIGDYRLRVYNNAIDTVTFSAYNGTNLFSENTGWREAKGNIPEGSASNWVNCNLNQEAFLGGRTARMPFNITAVQKEWLISPQFNCDSTTRLSFRHAALAFDDVTAPFPSRLGGDDSLAVMVSANCGASWQRIYLFTKDSLLKPFFRTVRIPLTAFAGQRVQVAFYATEGSNAIGSNRLDFILDNILVVPSPARDLAVVALEEPFNNCGLQSSQPVKVRIFNNGLLPSGNFSVSYQLNSGSIVSQAVTSVIPSSQFATVDFSANAGFTNIDNYLLKVWVTQTGDSISINDTLKVRLDRFGTPSPVYNFSAYGGTNISSVYRFWSEGRGRLKPLGTQSAWTAQQLGSNTCAKIKLKKDTIAEWLIMNPVKLGGDPKLKFRAALRDSGNNNPSLFDDDRIYVMVSADCGASWNPVFVFADSVNPAISNLFQNYTIGLSDYENQEVIIAFLARDFAFAQYISEFFLDDIQVISAAQVVDLGPVVLISPPASLVAGTSYPVIARLKNYGNVPVADAFLFASIAEENFSSFIPGPLAPGGSTDVYLGDFTAPFSGPITGKVYTSQTGDLLFNNDTLSVFWDNITANRSFSGAQGGSIHVFPNPAKDRIFFRLSSRSDQPESISVIDALGREIHLKFDSPGPGLHAADVSVLPRGIYRLRILFQDKIFLMNFCTE